MRKPGFAFSPFVQTVASFGIATGGAVLLFAIGVWRTHSLAHAYLISNLLLAYLPLFFGLWLRRVLRRKLWSSWEAIAASVLWLAFLPNSFYMVSDFIHIREVYPEDVLYDTVMFASFIFIAFTAGLISLYLVHDAFRKRFGRWTCNAWLAAIILLCSFAIYLGRDLRWNSWDILINPGGLLFDISDRLLHPFAYPDMFIITATFSVLIGSSYGVFCKGAALLRSRSLPASGKAE